MACARLFGGGMMSNYPPFSDRSMGDFWRVEIGFRLFSTFFPVSSGFLLTYDRHTACSGGNLLPGHPFTYR